MIQKKPELLFIVTGSIAAYKTPDIAKKLIEEGFNVQVVLSHTAEKFVTRTTMQTITENSIYNEGEFVFDPCVRHIELAKTADIILIAPATANIIGKMAHGIADDFITSIFLAIQDHKPIFIAPAMNTHMWASSIVQNNVNILSNLCPNIYFVGPVGGTQICGDQGIGNMSDIDTIVSIIKENKSIIVRTNIPLASEGPCPKEA